MVENIFNKTKPEGNGTLVGNWYEERCMKDFTGEGRYKFKLLNIFRTITKEHIPKKHLNFEEPIKTDKVFDNTHDRIYG